MRHLSIVAMAVAASLGGCIQAPPPNRIYASADSNIVPEPQYAYGASQSGYDPGGQPPQDESVTTVYIDPPLEQPPPIRVEWAPPPLLDEWMPPQPYPDAIWTGGYWVWQDNWVWARGRWVAPPRRDYRWVQPYYEHRGDSVIFINGFWAAPGVSFRRPPPNLTIPFARVRPGVTRGPRPAGPDGPFMPPPHGARRGSFAPAPAPEPQAGRGREQQQGQERGRPQQNESPRMEPPRMQAPLSAPQIRPPVNPSNAPSIRQDNPDRAVDRNRDRNQGGPQQGMPSSSAPPAFDRPRPENGPRGPSPQRDSAQPAPQRMQPERNADRNPAERPPQIQRQPQPQLQPQPQPRPQPQPMPQVQPQPRIQQPAPQPRPEHRAPPPEDNAPAQPDEKERGRRER